tara:strand:- start:601 stop:1560 length:960 start_codon:yes stop_codon:yes gene_type:complete
MIKIALDIMGGDNAPQSNIGGAIDFLNKNQGSVKIYMIGDEKIILSELEKNTKISNNNFEIIHTSQIIDLDDQPSKIIKRKPDSSMNKAICLLKDNIVDAVISSGNTGCLVSSAFFNLGTIDNIKRPALFTIIPSENGSFLLGDVGANSSSNPNQLLQFSKMASIYMECLLKIKKPKVGLLNIGLEPNKGTETIKESYNLMEKELNNFIGNIESRYIFDGKADIVICDGFTGNIVLKLIEGMMSYNLNLISEKLNLKSVDIVNNLKSIYDYEQYGAAPILGVNGLVLKSHGSSSKISIFNALKNAQKLCQVNLLSKFKS